MTIAKNKTIPSWQQKALLEVQREFRRIENREASTSNNGRQETLRLTYDAAMLAEALGVSLRHIRRMDASGQIPRGVRLGRAKRWIVADIEAWLNAGSPSRERWEAMKKNLGKSLRT